MITHIWEGYKLDAVTKGMQTADMGICMSKETLDFLVLRGIQKEKLTYIHPAHDSLPRKTKKILVSTNVYPDGCKNEGLFYDLIAFLKTCGTSENFEFTLMGSGWNNVAGMTYYDKFDYFKYLELLQQNDYMLYFGKDEGAMSILDAAQVGMKTIAPNIGYHIPLNIDYPFSDKKDLFLIFSALAKNPVWDWTWKKYAKEHQKIWEKL